MELRIKNLYKAYGELQVLCNFNMNLVYNKIHCIFGPSGCGKTTLLNLITKLSPMDEGAIEGIEEKNCSYIFQEDRLLPWATVEENILLVLGSGYKKSEKQEILDSYLSLVNLSEFKNCYPEELSGGMKQRTSIARAFAYGGDILVMDEPFKGIHLELKKELVQHIMNYKRQKNRLLILVTHDIEEAIYMADEIHIFQGPPLILEKQITIDIPQNLRVHYTDKMNEYREILSNKEVNQRTT
ncbi:ABC-type nitrate/sulfonate/bicarbonate transport system, ATpase component [Clostridium aceticum]|uniref:ABC-type nitrate/sulfonate/bicarbonate transport system, ATpase component n=1 Tax=Clostridium aceticum TaxID=84022 RepID=A0A0D8I8A9_9CLOT|nr:ABC transporter ATP-binding protein [Clostridium aceticum]AKL97244.1 ABC-type nitrate/sulfonate/bicarbonate transport system, ATpase component [Clostridium aceticum]KJF26272.1 hypothetical protein TZ02_13930 [Clostridium aceticum]